MTRFLLPNPITPSIGAWYVAVSIIGQVDLSETALRYELPLDDIFVQPESIPYDLLRESIGRAQRFTATLGNVNDDASDFTSICLFSSVGYRDNPRRIVAELHQEALQNLQQLQNGIKQLLRQNKLTQSALTIRMKRLAPSTAFHMKKDRSYKQNHTSPFIDQRD